MAVKGPFKVEFADVFPFGAGVVGDVVPMRDFDRSTPERPVQQRDPEDPSMLFWQVDVMDFDPEAREKVVRVKILAPYQPVPPPAVPGLPIRPVILEGLTITPYVKVAQVIKERRMALGLSQAELGAMVGMDARRIRHYESGGGHPSLAGAKLLAKALNITLDELVDGDQLDLSGEWWSAWQGLETDTTLQRVLILHRGRKAEINTPPAASGGTHSLPWNGELTILDDRALGWYVLENKHRGVLNLKLSQDQLLGHWMTATGFRPGPSGFIALARTSLEAQHLVETERQHSRTRWEPIDDPHS